MRAGRGAPPRRHDWLAPLAFNICLLLLPLSAATAMIVIARDHLYAYEYSERSARQIANRVARLNGELIQVDFDRQNQWSDLVDLELRSNDRVAARGFLLSGSGMLPRRAANILGRSDTSDAEREVAALQLLTPSTRARYVASGPLLSDRRNEQRTLPPPEPIGDARDFELLARAVLADPNTDPLQFILTGYSLGLAGELSPRMARGASALLDASRRDDYPGALGEEVAALFTASMPIEAFHTAARARAQGDAAGNLANASAAFRASLVPRKAVEARQLLEQIGQVSELTSRPAAAALLTHATSLRDMPRLMLLAQAAGDRVAAAAKRLPRDGRLLSAARGRLTWTRDLTAALVMATLAALGIVALVVLKLVESSLDMWRRWDDQDEYSGELVDIGGSSNWRPL